MFKSISKFMSAQSMTFTNKKKRQPHSVLLIGFDAVSHRELYREIRHMTGGFTLSSPIETITVHNLAGYFNITFLTDRSGQHGNTLQYLTQLRHQREPLPAAIVFVVDSVRPDTLYEAKEVLWTICGTYEALAKEQEQEQGQARSLMLLVLASNTCPEKAMLISDVKDSLDLERRASKSMRWHIRETEMCFGNGTYEGFIWLGTQLSAAKPTATITSTKVKTEK